MTDQASSRISSTSEEEVLDGAVAARGPSTRLDGVAVPRGRSNSYLGYDYEDRIQPESDSPQQTEILGLLWRRKWFLVLGLVVALCLGVVYHSQQQPVYQSSARILITRSGPPLPALGLSADGAYYQQQGNVATHAMIIRSPVIARRAVEGSVEQADTELLELVDAIDREIGMPDEEVVQVDPLPARAGISSLLSLTGRDPVAAVLGGLNVRQPGGATEIMDLTYRGPHPEDCKTILEAVFGSYQEYLKGTRDNATRDTARLISKAKDELTQELGKRQEKYEQFRLQNAKLLLRGEDGRHGHYERLSEARSQLIIQRTQLTSRIKVLQQALDDGAGDSTLRAMLDQTNDSLMNNERESLSSQLMPLRLEMLQLVENSGYGEDHPELVALRKRMQLVEQEYLASEGAVDEEAEGGDETQQVSRLTSQRDWTPRDLVEMHLRSLRHQMNTLAVEQAELERQFTDQESEAEELEKLVFQEGTLKDDVERTRQLYDVVVSRLDEVKLTDDLGGYEADMISPPGVGGQVEPSLTRTLGVSVFLGLMGGFGLAYLVDLGDKTFRNAEDVQRALGLPLIGHIPVIDARRVAVDEAKRQLSAMLVTVHKRQSPLSESFRGVRTALYFSTSGQGHQVLQVTSASPGDGKSTVAANIAISIAQSDKTALLIDADCRRPMVAKLFGCERKRPGLSSVIREELEPVDAIFPSGIDNLSVMTSGPPVGNPAELLTSARFRELLQSLKQKYDFVIVDSPPLLAVSDPSAVSAHVDSTILVLRMTKKARGAAVRATEMLHSLNANILGVVVNGVGQRKGYGYGGYGSGKYGGYAKGAYYGYGFGGYEYSNGRASKYYATEDVG